MTSCEPNSVVTDSYLSSFVNEMLTKEWLQLSIKAAFNDPVGGTPVFNTTDFVKSNWRDDPEKIVELTQLSR